MPTGIQSTSQPAKQENNLLKMSASTSSTSQSVLMENTSACAPTTSQSVLETTSLKMSESASSTTNLADLETEQSTHNHYYIPVEIIHPLPSSSGISMGPRKKKRINVSGVVLTATATPYKEQLKIQQTPKINTHKRCHRIILGADLREKGEEKAFFLKLIKRSLRMSLPGNHKYKCSVCPNIFYWPIRDEHFKNKKFFKFPSDCEQRKKWCEQLKVSYATKEMHLCEDHFNEMHSQIP
ncbi:hypothetical protein JTB14_021394 [Gonioctena quinquepunctata]|nr:hypothetical protein JTB14_021394 [Gonioctena quinquepunctata]